ncbi:arsenate reductase ArsC [Bordetella hinzii]|uniref:arsenate reductase ArsC n=1 Tax=Bordetella hinzii TaxID=103855 RepID=UPI003F193A0A
MSASRNVLFLCTANSARSILAEGLFNSLAGAGWKAYSAGSHPKGEVHPLALATLQALGLPAEGYRSKSWDEFAGGDAPPMDVVITVCDAAAGEACPLWPGRPLTAHWGVADPAACAGGETEQRKAFHDAARVLKRRIQLFLSLPFDRLDRPSMQDELRGIGKTWAPLQ